MIRKMIHHLIGTVMIAFGISIMLNTKIGAFPWDANNEYIYQAFDGNIPFTVIMIMTGTILILIGYLLTRNTKVFYGFIMLVLTSLFIDLFRQLLGPLGLDSHILIQISCAFMGLIILAIGSNFTILSGLMAGPIELMMTIIDKKINNLFLSRMFMELIFLTSAVIVGISINNVFEQINWFTFVAVLTISIFVSSTHPIVRRITKVKELI